MDETAHTTDIIRAGYQELDSALSRSDYHTYLSLLSVNHETVHPDERRVTRQMLEDAPFPFDGVRDCRTVHSLLKVNPGRTGCTTLAESSSEMTVGARPLHEDLLVLDLWCLEMTLWKLRRRIILRQKRQSAGHFSWVEHPLYCQFGLCLSEKSTWKDPRQP